MPFLIAPSVTTSAGLTLLETPEALNSYRIHKEYNLGTTVKSTSFEISFVDSFLTTTELSGVYNRDVRMHLQYWLIWAKQTLLKIREWRDTDGRPVFVEYSAVTITHSFLGKANCSLSQFPWTSLSWLIKLGLHTALNFSWDSQSLPIIFNIIRAFFSGWGKSLYSCRGDQLQIWAIRIHWGKKTWIFPKIYRGTVNSFMQRLLLSAWLSDILGRGVCVSLQAVAFRFKYLHSVILTRHFKKTEQTKLVAHHQVNQPAPLTWPVKVKWCRQKWSKYLTAQWRSSIQLTLHQC